MPIIVFLHSCRIDFTMKRYFTIPVFIPEKACPFRCIYCNQFAIADRPAPPSPEEVEKSINRYLTTIPSDAYTRIAFFGGSFTGMSMEEQNLYLDVALPYIERGQVREIQLSTRPDYINPAILENLKKYRVKIIELGAQSLDEEVLLFSGRRHTAEDVRNASAMIIGNGFELGLQMMIGLPKDTLEKSLYTAGQIVKTGARYTRIYPTLVIKDTPLEEMYHSGNYSPLSLAEAVEWTKAISRLFDDAHVQILRTGLHPSEGLISGNGLVDGPFHVSFKELVSTSLWRDILAGKIKNKSGKELAIHVAPNQYNAAIGYGARNKKEYLEKFGKVVFKKDESLTGYECAIEITT